MKKLFLILILILLSGCTLSNKSLGTIREQRFGAIVDTIKIDNQNKEIKYTDENVGEEFIIKSDNKDYYGFGGNSIMYFSITNISDTDQNANIVYSLGEKVNIVGTKRFNRNDITETQKIIPATSTTTEQQITEKNEVSIWDDIKLGSSLIKQDKIRKTIRDRISKNGFSDNFKSGEIKYYQAEVNIPLGVNNDEFFIEAFGDKSYGHLDPNAWTYSQNFNDLNVATLNGQDSFSIVGGAWSVTTGGTPYEGTKHASTTGSAQTNVTRSISSITNGTMYFSMKKLEANSGYIDFYLGGGNGIYIIFKDTGKIRIYDHTTEIDSGFTYSADTYIRFGISFETGAGAWDCNGGCAAISADHYRFNINNGAWSETEYGSYSALASVSSLTVDFDGGTANDKGYFDYISPNYIDAVASAPDQSNDLIIFE